jgi:hypothetical protein
VVGVVFISLTIASVHHWLRIRPFYEPNQLNQPLVVHRQLLSGPSTETSHMATWMRSNSSGLYRPEIETVFRTMFLYLLDDLANRAFPMLNAPLLSQNDQLVKSTPPTPVANPSNTLDINGIQTRKTHSIG